MSSPHRPARNDDRQLAWTLIDFARPHLPRRLRISLVTMIGAGEIENAIVDLIDYCSQFGVQVPNSLINPLLDWASGYRGTPLERTLRIRIAELLPGDEQTAQSCGPTGRSSCSMPASRPEADTSKARAKSPSCS